MAVSLRNLVRVAWRVRDSTDVSALFERIIELGSIFFGTGKMTRGQLTERSLPVG